MMREILLLFGFVVEMYRGYIGMMRENYYY